MAENPLDSPLENLPQREIYTISRLNREARQLLEGSFPLLWVEGEISNFARPSSGHWYLSLKDEAAQVRCAMFRTRNRLVRFSPKNGMHVMMRARISLYEARGDYQLIIEHMEDAGDGALRREYEQLKQRLAEEGLFDAERHQPLPALPQKIGVITSPTGAALRDILSILKRRFPAIPVLIYPTQVQGKTAAMNIAHMITLAAQRDECDVLILARGGGSLEDLWAFNEECVARAMADCETPIITGIGHETDTTIADFVADVRAPTPSGAAELVSPDQDEWLQILQRQESRCLTLFNQQFRQHQQGLKWLTSRLQQQHPGQQLQQHSQRLDELEQRLLRGMQSTLRQGRSLVNEQQARLQVHNPLRHIQRHQAHFKHLQQRLSNAIRIKLGQTQTQLQGLGRALDAVSPLATLGRGYAIARRLPDGPVLHRADEAQTGDTLEVRLARGQLICEVIKTETQ